VTHSFRVGTNRQRCCLRLAQLAIGSPFLLGSIGSARSTNAPPAAVHGTVRLDVALSDAMGWRSTLPMVAPTPLKAVAANLAATLDLSRIQSLATSVASQTGLGAVPVNVAVTASAVVAVGSAKPVQDSSQLPFQLTPWT
jgi:hypothetical protein